MDNFLHNLYFKLPNFLHNLMVTAYNIKSYRNRTSGDYNKWKEYYNSNENLSLIDLKKIQFKRFIELLEHSIDKSSFYQSLYKGINISEIKNIKDIVLLPIINKEDLRKNVAGVITIPKEKALVAKTGGTTGKSLQVYNRPCDVQERLAYIDNFRGKYGYKLGKKTAWFSGKSLLTDRDVKKNRFWKTDYYHNVRYYSSYHVKNENLEYYVKNLIKYAPSYFVGFPSTMYEIAKYGPNYNLEFPKDIVKAVFPTAETLTIEMKEKIEQFFKTKVYDQYASSEGAPFIIACGKGNLHLELQFGVFEVLNEHDQPTTNGRLVITSFTTWGTPLIRYDIGDGVELSTRTCSCGNNNPLVEKITGRVYDYILSPEVGKINVVNLANSLKNTFGIVNFQIVQDSLEELTIKMVIDEKLYSKESEKMFLSNIRERMGNKIGIVLDFVEEIPVEASGKFRMIKNNLKDSLKNN